MSPVPVSVPVGIGSPASVAAGVAAAAGGGRGVNPGGRHWGSGISATNVGNHPNVPVYGQWGVGSHGQHHHHILPSPSSIHHSVSGVYQPHSAGSAQQHGMGLDDDKEIVHNARAALDWLERGDTYT
jgi:hypothetical protein